MSILTHDETLSRERVRALRSPISLFLCWIGSKAVAEIHRTLELNNLPELRGRLSRVLAIWATRKLSATNLGSRERNHHYPRRKCD
jgi:hypothetical protein